MSIPGKPFFTGRYRHQLDDKNRLTIPSAWRVGFSETDPFMVTPHADGYLMVLPHPEIEVLYQRVSAMQFGDGDAQDAVTQFFSETLTTSFDKQGRIMITPELLEHAGIEKDVVLAGGLNKFNIFSPARWEIASKRGAGPKPGDAMRRLGI